MTTIYIGMLKGEMTGVQGSRWLAKHEDSIHILSFDGLSYFLADFPTPAKIVNITTEQANKFLKRELNGA